MHAFGVKKTYKLPISQNILGGGVGGVVAALIDT